MHFKHANAWQCHYWLEDCVARFGCAVLECVCLPFHVGLRGCEAWSQQHWCNKRCLWNGWMCLTSDDRGHDGVLFPLLVSLTYLLSYGMFLRRSRGGKTIFYQYISNSSFLFSVSSSSSSSNFCSQSALRTVFRGKESYFDQQCLEIYIYIYTIYTV